MYTLSTTSRGRLVGIHPDLVAVVDRAIQLTTVDFGIAQGLRTPEEQAKNVAKGVSATQNSRHLDGHAVDLQAYIDGVASWDWKQYGLIALAMKLAAGELDTPLEWGGVWDTELSQLSDDPYQDHLDYVDRFEQANGRKPLQDGPHFQLTRKAYP